MLKKRKKRTKESGSNFERIKTNSIRKMTRGQTIGKNNQLKRKRKKVKKRRKFTR